MGRPQISVNKRQREQARRERKQLKQEKRDRRKSEPRQELGSGPPIEADPTPES